MGDAGPLGSTQTTTTATARCDKDNATKKPNARRVGNGMEGASRVVGTLARNNSFHHELRAYELIIKWAGWRCDGALRRPRDYAGLVFLRERVTAQCSIAPLL